MNDFQIPNCYYRVSIKALILSDTRDKFLITKEDNGMWELPGGGLDHGETPHSDLPREISEEMGLTVTSIADHPSYFFPVPIRIIKRRTSLTSSTKPPLKISTSHPQMSASISLLSIKKTRASTTYFQTYLYY